MAERGTQTQRFEHWVRRRSIIVILVLAAALTGAVFEVAHGVNYVNGRVRHAWLWRGAEYRRFTELEAGMTVSKFVAVLGQPVFSRTSKNRRFHEYSFRRRGYWVQAIADPEGTVEMFSVTSCDPTFRPTFRFLDTVVQLQESTFGDVSAPFDPIPVDYHGLTATANVHFFDVLYGGNPGNYKTYAWGLNDACPDWFDKTRDDRSLAFDFVGASSVDDATIQRFRRTHAVNTYAETAVGANLWDMVRPFQIGVDRILTRTLTGSVGGRLSTSGKVSYPNGRYHFNADATNECIASVFSFRAVRYAAHPALFNTRPKNFRYFVEGTLVIARPRGDPISFEGEIGQLPRYAEIAFLSSGFDSAYLTRLARKTGMSAWRRRNAVILMPRPTALEIRDAAGRRSAVPFMRAEEVRSLTSCLSPATRHR